MHRHVRSNSKPRRRRTDDKLDLDELMTAPNLGGMLSFLEVPPEEARRRQDLRQAIDQELNNPQGYITGVVENTTATSPTAGVGTLESNDATQSQISPANEPVDASAVVEQPTVGIRPSDSIYGLDTGRNGIHCGSIHTTSEYTTVANTTPDQTPTTVGKHETIDQVDLDEADGVEAAARIKTKPTLVVEYTEVLNTTEVHTPPVVTFSSKTPPLPKAPNDAAYLGTHRRERIFRATLVQHGHSPTEQILYQCMWNHGSSLPDGSRQITAGYRELGYMTNLNDKTVKYNLQSLEQKLAIRVTAPEHTASRTGRTYQVFSYEQILPRRSQAGLVWVRKTKGVEFVSVTEPQSSQNRLSPTVVTKPSRLSTGPILDVTQGRATTVCDDTPAAGDIATTEPVGLPTTQLGISLGTKKKLSTSTTASVDSSEPPPLNLVKAISRIFPAIDHHAVKTLWSECRSRAGNCTIEEVIYFVTDKLPIAKNGKIQNPVGFILTSVPRCFEGDTFTNFRDAQTTAQRAREEAQTKRAEQERLIAEACQRAEERFTALSADEYNLLYESIKLPLLAGSTAAKRWDKQTLDATIRQRILQEFQDSELARLL